MCLLLQVIPTQLTGVRDNEQKKKSPCHFIVLITQGLLQLLTLWYSLGRRYWSVLTDKIPVFISPFLVIKYSILSISCTQRIRTSPRTMI